MSPVSPLVSGVWCLVSSSNNRNNKNYLLYNNLWLNLKPETHFMHSHDVSWPYLAATD